MSPAGRVAARPRGGASMQPPMTGMRPMTGMKPPGTGMRLGTGRRPVNMSAPPSTPT